MHLDLPTIYAVMAFACLAIGTVQLLSFATGRFDRWPVWWGGSNLMIGIGTMMLALQGLQPGTTVIVVSDLLTVIGYALLFVGVRSFAKRPFVRWSTLPCAFGIAVVAVFHDPLDYQVRIGLLSLLYGCWDAAIAFDGHRLRRTERLRSAWLMVAAFAPTAILFLVRALLALDGRLGGNGPAAATNETHAWLAVSAAAFLMMRNMSLLMLAAERGHRDLLLLAHTDPLTGALNRAGLLERARGLAGRVTTAAVLALDVDHFKQLNDTHGHATGDEMLRKIRQSAVDAMRDGDLLGRWGGDEFILLLPDTNARDALDIAEALKARFAEAVGGSSITISIGCAVGAFRGNDLLPILKRADEALYAAKRLGRDRISLADAAKRRLPVMRVPEAA